MYRSHAIMQENIVGKKRNYDAERDKIEIFEKNRNDWNNEVKMTNEALKAAQKQNDEYDKTNKKKF